MMMDINVLHLGGGFGLLGPFNYEKYSLEFVYDPFVTFSWQPKGVLGF